LLECHQVPARSVGGGARSALSLTGDGNARDNARPVLLPWNREPWSGDGRHHPPRTGQNSTEGRDSGRAVMGSEPMPRG
jgi:hypothetical protein